MTLRTVLTLVVVAMVTVGCGSDATEAVEPPHSIHEPWQVEPFAVDQALLTSAQAACGDMVAEQRAPEGALSLVAADARGGSHLFLVSANQNAESECFVEIAPTGEATTKSGGASSGDVFKPLVPGGIELVGSSSGSTGADTMSWLVGRAGPGVARVVVTLADNRPVVASLSSLGWYAAWWPDGTPSAKVTAYDGAGVVTSTSATQ
ncbi:MAG: hypothetical protein ACJ76W_02760 [Chloroflexota bacterium]